MCAMCLQLNRTSPSTAVMEVQKAIKSLSDVPEEFYEVLVPLVTELNKHVQSPSILKAVVQEIFETVRSFKTTALVK